MSDKEMVQVLLEAQPVYRKLVEFLRAEQLVPSGPVIAALILAAAHGSRRFSDTEQDREGFLATCKYLYSIQAQLDKMWLTPEVKGN